MIFDALIGPRLCERHIHGYFVHVLHKIFFFSPVLVDNWVSYVFLPNFISSYSTPFTALELLGLVFVFSRSLVSISPAYIIFHLGFYISSGCPMSSFSIYFFCDIIFDGDVFLVTLVFIFDDVVTRIFFPL